MPGLTITAAARPRTLWPLILLLAVLMCAGTAGAALAADAPPLCRFGAAASQSIPYYPISNLRIGWYADWAAIADPARPGGVDYMQMVRFTATGPSTYTAKPTGDALIAIARQNPGATWIVGNEPDRKLFQDGLLPEVYARAYHDLYFQIRAADPTARITAGSIVQPTPLRLEYLDKVLSSYQAQFGTRLPADAWNIHGFILREMSCDYDPNSCWGADVPPGSSQPYGMLYDINDNDNIDIFKQFIVDFRQWMQARGYQRTALIITEFGILMPPDYGFDAPRVNAFMNNAFDYLLTASGPTGYPLDGNRYVQQFAWYSLDDYTFNGVLFDTQTRLPTAFGQNYAAYTGKVASQVNLQLVSVSATVSGGANGVRIVTNVVNNGNIRLAAPIKVRVYDGNLASGGRPIAADVTINAIDGCAARVVQAAVGPLSRSLPAGAKVWVAVDPDNAIAETNEGDNATEVALPRATHWQWLPTVQLGR